MNIQNLSPFNLKTRGNLPSNPHIINLRKEVPMQTAKTQKDVAFCGKGGHTDEVNDVDMQG
jgi:hypothetical protein